jgi:tRNA A-37 threonylcarbamoyl transferase component Bud32
MADVGTAARALRRTCPRCGETFEGSAAFCPSDGSALVATSDGDPYIGTIVHADIEIRSLAGAGAMGKVYRAYQRGIDRDVAVKILHRELSGNTSLVQRFHREAKIASRLQHPHVVEMYLAGQLPDGALFIVMEYLDGVSLATAIAEAMPVPRAISIALQLCDAVGAGHARGIVHRDLKPENIMLVDRADTQDWVKVLDFGIAKVSLGDQSMETAAGHIFGTARYISPEGAQGAVVGPPGDVYSIAVILYQLLSNRTPFDADQPVGLLVKHIHDTPPPLRSWPSAASVPEPIARVIMDTLAKDPAARAPNARALGAAIAAAAREANVSVSDVGVFARMSLLDAGSKARTIGLDPTIDDAAAMPAPRVATLEVPVRIEPRVPDSRRSGRRVPWIALLTFLLGAALSVLAMQAYQQRADTTYAAHVKRAHRALAQGHYVDPPGENVRDLTRGGLERWPDDGELGKIRSDAAHELVTRAMAARSAGDVTGARDLAKTAQELDPSDGTAKLLVDQYDDEIEGAIDAGVVAGGPRVSLEIPPGPARPGGRAELVAKVTAAGNPRTMSGAQFMVLGPGLPKQGLAIPGGTGPTFRAMFVPPRDGLYEIQFEAGIDGAMVRASRSLYVSK